MFRPEPLDIVLIVFVALLLFGANRLPETARAIGQSMREFRNALTNKDESEPVQTTPKIVAKPEPTAAEPVTSTVVAANTDAEIQTAVPTKS